MGEKQDEKKEEKKKDEDDDDDMQVKFNPLGTCFEASFTSLVKTSTPIPLIKVWTKRSTGVEATEEDMWAVHKVEDARVNAILEQLLYNKTGEVQFKQLYTAVLERLRKHVERVKVCAGYFISSNGIRWRIFPNGSVMGVTANGNQIRDEVIVYKKSKEGGDFDKDNTELHIGPFTLDESETSQIMHFLCWKKRGDADKSAMWNWKRDGTMSSRYMLMG